MRVLHIYSGNLYGGIETMLTTLARHRAVCPEMESHFALSFEGRLSEELRAAGANVHQLGNVRASRPASVLRARRALAELLRENDFDVAVCHAPWSQAVFGKTVRACDVPLVFWQHDAAGGHHWLERWARRTPPDLAICNSRFTASTLSNLYPQTRAEVIYCPVTLTETYYSNDERAATRDELETPAKATVIIQVSRIEKWKGHALHLEALSRLTDLPDWMCWLVGGAQRPQEAAYYEELKQAAARLGIKERVRFVGERADIARLLHAADIFCQPNRSPEPFGIALIEALHAGLPVVTTALGGAREIVDDSCGVLVEPANAEALAEALRELIVNHGRRSDLGSRGAARALQLCDAATQLQSLRSALMSVSRLELVG
ncbi:MAG TPA: glycosyltransferase [Pyrinomonadaceae bacterium]